MIEFKEHAQEEVSVPLTINHNHSASSGSLSADVKSSGYIMSMSQNGSMPREEEYKLEYWGRYEVPPPASANSDQVMVIDSLVSKLREAIPSAGGSGGSTLSSKFRPKKRSFGARLMGRSSKAPPDAVDFSAATTSGVECEGLGECSILGGNHTHNHHQGPCTDSRDGSDVSITVQSSSPTLSPPDKGESAQGHGSSTSPDDPADYHTSCEQQTRDTSTSSLSAQPNGRVRTESADFDTIPELANLKSSTEFQALSMKTVDSVNATQKVRLLFSGVSVMVVTEQSENVILKKSIKTIACCAQVSGLTTLPHTL